MKLTHTLIAIATGFAVSLSPVLSQKASAQNFTNEKIAICGQLNSGKSLLQLTTEWGQYVESMISMNQLSPGQRNEAYQLFGNVTVQAVKTYCPAHMQAVYEFARQAPSYTQSSGAVGRLYDEFRRANVSNGLFP
jgi:hypothetical protein